jgi:dihydropyrimidinase
MTFDTIIRGGTVATASDTFRCDVGITGGRIAALGESLGDARETVDASAKLVLPGGIDSHVHFAQPSGPGIVMADDFASGTRAAAFGGNTMVLPFAMQQKGESLREVVKQYHAKADGQCYVDVSFHLIIADATDRVLGQELPALVDDGYTSFKVFMTYEGLALSDMEMLNVMTVARETGALVMIHAENYDAIRFLTDRLERAGKTAPHYHAASRPIPVEREATHRAISLSEIVDVPIMIVHVSNRDAMEEIRRAQQRGLKIYGETCPQYLVLTEKDLEGLNMEGTKYVLSPAARQSEPAGVLGGPAAAGVLAVLVGPLPVPLRRSAGQARPERPDLVSLGAERHSRRRDAAADPVFRGRRQGPHHAQRVRRADRDQPRQDLRALSEKGHDCGRQRRRYRDLGS